VHQPVPQGKNPLCDELVANGERGASGPGPVAGGAT